MSATVAKRLLLVAVILAAATVIYFNRQSLSVEKLQAFAGSFSPVALIVAFLLMPLIGAPISVFLIATGLRFGFPLGMLITSATLVFHHLIAFRLAHGRWRKWIHHQIARKGRKIPELDPAHQAGWTALFAAVAGPPYAVKLYLLALTNVRFRIYFGVGVPMYTLCSMPAVAAGSMVGRFNALWFSLAGVVIATGVITVRLIRKRAAAKRIASCD